MGLEAKGKAGRNMEREQKAEAGVGQEYHQTREMMRDIYCRQKMSISDF